MTMKKYRGMRGARNYLLEAQELVLPATFLAGMCFAVLVLTAFLFAFSGQGERRGMFAVGAFETVMVFAGQGESLHSRSLLDGVALYDYSVARPPIVPISWSDDIFFDAYLGKVIFPLGFEFEIGHAYHYLQQTVSFEGAEFSRRFVSLSRYGVLPIRILRYGDGFTFFTRRGVFLEAGENEEYSYIRFVDPRERYHTIVIIDAGHGGHDSGAPSVNRGEPYEKEINLAVAQKLLEIFDEPGVLLIPTRTCDYFVSPRSRARIANSLGDYFISIHSNADARSRLSRGTLTLHGTADGSYELAQMFQYSLVEALHSQNRGIHYSPEFYILRNSNVPVVLLELLFQSNPEDATRLAQEQTQMLIAQVLAETIANLPHAR